MLRGRYCSYDLSPLDVFPVYRNHRELFVPGAETRFPLPRFEISRFSGKAKLFLCFFWPLPYPALRILALEAS